MASEDMGRSSAPAGFSRNELSYLFSSDSTSARSAWSWPQARCTKSLRSPGLRSRAELKISAILSCFSAILLAFLQLARKPCFRQPPVSFDRRRRNSGYFRDLLNIEPTEETEFDNSRL